MGDSLPPPAAFDLISSFARRRGADIEIVLAEPKLDLTENDVTVSLRRGRSVISATGHTEHSDAGDRLVVRLPRVALADGTWALAIERREAPRERVSARLLVQGRRPLVLLWGANDPPSAVPAPRRAVTPRRRAAAVAGRALDRALTVLPEDRATSTRAGIRTAARRVLR